MSVRAKPIPQRLSGAFILQVVIDNQVTCNIRTRNGISVKEALAEKLENTGGRKWQNFIVYTKWTRVMIDWEIDVLCVRGHALVVVNKMDPQPLPLPGSHHFLPTELIQQAILPHSSKDFWYILRPSAQTPGQFALAISTPSWPTSGGILRHVKITFDEATQQFSLCKKYFPDLDCLIECFKPTPIKAHNGPNMYLRYPVPVDKQLEEDCKRRFKIYSTRPVDDTEDDPDTVSLWSQGTPSCSYNYEGSVSGISDEDEEYRERTRSSTIISSASCASFAQLRQQQGHELHRQDTVVAGHTPLAGPDNPGFDAARKNLRLAFKNQHPQTRATSPPCTPQDNLERSLELPTSPPTPYKECIGSSDSDVIMRGSSTSSSGSFGQGSPSAIKKRNMKKDSSECDELSKLQSSPRTTFAAKLFKRKSSKDPMSPTRPQSEIFPDRKVEVPTRSYSAAPKFGTQLSTDPAASPNLYMTMEVSTKDPDSSSDLDLGDTYEDMSTMVRGYRSPERVSPQPSEPPSAPSELYEDMSQFNNSHAVGPDECYEDMSNITRNWQGGTLKTEEVAYDSPTRPRAGSCDTYEQMNNLPLLTQSDEATVHSAPSTDQEVKEKTLTRASTTKPRRIQGDDERRTLSRRAKSQYMNVIKPSHQYDTPTPSQHLYQNTASLRINHVQNQYANTQPAMDSATSEKLISNVSYLMTTVKQQAAEITALKKTVNQLKLSQKELEDELTAISASYDY